MNDPQPGQLFRSGTITSSRSGRARAAVLAIPHLHRRRDHNAVKGKSANFASLVFFGMMRLVCRKKALQLPLRKAEAYGIYEMRISLRFTALLPLLLLPIAGCSREKQSVEKYLQQAQAYETAGDLAKAAIELNKILKTSPLDAQVHAMLGKIEDQRGNTQSAIDNYILATNTNPNLLQPQIRLLELMIDADQLSAAMTRCNVALGLFPKNSEVLALRADIEQRLGNQKAAQADSAAAMAVDGSNARAIAVSATARIAAGDPQAGMKLLDTGLAAHPDSVRLLDAKAAALISKKDLQGAIEALETIVRLQPKRVLAQSSLAAARSEAGYPDQALKGLREAALADPADPRMQLAFVGFLKQHGKTEDAVASLNDLISKNANSSLYDLTLADVLLAQGNTEQAEQALRAAQTRLGPTSSGYPVALALAKLGIATNKPDMASRQLDRVLTTDPDNKEALLTDALLLSQSGQVTNAIKRCMAVIKQDPMNVQAFQLLATSYMMSRQPSLAVDAMQRAVVLQPQNLGMQLQLADMMQAAGRSDAARDLLNRLALQFPEAPTPWLGLSTLAANRGDFEGGDRAAARLRSMPGAAGIASQATGYLQMARGDFTAATQSYEAAVETLPNPDAGLLAAFVNAASRSGAASDAARVLERKADGVASNERTLLWIAAMDLWGNAKAFDKADEAFAKATAAAPNQLAPYEAYMPILASRKQFDRAVTIIQDGIQKGTPQWSMLLLKGSVDERAGNPLAAMEAYKQALDLNPRSERALNNYASLLSDLQPQNKSELETVRRQMSPLEGSMDPLTIDTVAWLSYRLGRFEDAKALLTRIDAAKSSNPQIRFHLAAVLLASGDKTGGLALLDTVKGLTFPGSDDVTKLSQT